MDISIWRKVLNKLNFFWGGGFYQKANEAKATFNMQFGIGFNKLIE